MNCKLENSVENELLDMYDYAWNKHKNTIGPLQLFISMVQNRNAGEQGTRQGETNKEFESFLMVISIVCLHQVPCSLSSKKPLVPILLTSAFTREPQFSCQFKRE